MAKSGSDSAPAWCDSELARTAWAIGVDVAGPVADEVDRDARFPSEAVDAMRAAGVLSAMVPTEFGGAGASLRDVAVATRALAGHCAASALVLSMHQIEIWYLMHHGHTDGLRNLLRRVVTDGTLIANGNSEVGLGGDVGHSNCAVEPIGDRFRLEKDTLAVSYGASADALLLTARRAPDAAPGDQVMVACNPGMFKLEQLSTWDTTGLRGTCSAGFRVVVEDESDMIFPVDWATISNHAVGATVIFLSSVWLGIAESAASRAHAYVRADARRKIGVTPAAAPALAELVVTLGEARAVMTSTIDFYLDAVESGATENPMLVLAIRNLKLSQTTLAHEIVLKASLICGLAGYKRDSPYSMDRHVRDIIGAPLMAHNFRTSADNARLLLAIKQL